MKYAIAGLAVCLGVNALPAAVALRGTVRNGTTGKPAAGDEVVLMSIAGSPIEIGRGKTDTGGRFSFAVGDSRDARLIRVIHQGVAYHNPAPADANPVEIQVYDAASQLDGLFATWNVRLQTQGDTLQIIEEFKVRNASDPPRTLMSDRPFEIQLPHDADVLAGKVQVGDGRPTTRKPAPGDQRGQYYFPVPLPPGDARFAVAYRLPYRGEAVIECRIHYPLEQFVVVLPRSMKFEGKIGDTFRPMTGETEANVQVVTAAVKPGQPPAFRISGSGRVLVANGGGQQDQSGQTAGLGGRLPTPAGPSGPLDNDRWVFLGGFAVVLAAAAGGILSHKRKTQSLSASNHEAGFRPAFPRGQ